MEFEHQLNRFGGSDSCRAIALRAYFRLKEYMPRRPYDPVFEAEEEAHEWHMRMCGIDRRIREDTIVVIVFTGIHIEAYIYDFAARHLGDNYVRKYLDRLSLLSKWVIIPKIVANHILDPGGQAYQALQDLIKDRNQIVHWKSEDGHKVLESGRLREVGALSIDGAYRPAMKAIEALEILADEAEKFDPEHGKWVLGVPADFEKHTVWNEPKVPVIPGLRY